MYFYDLGSALSEYEIEFRVRIPPVIIKPKYTKMEFYYELSREEEIEMIERWDEYFVQTPKFLALFKHFEEIESPVC